VSNIGHKRRRHDKRGRFVLSMFVLAWLNLAVQPCLMAMESAPEPVVASAQSIHADHANHSPDHDCDHCPPLLNGHAKVCVSATASNCDSTSSYNYDGRNGHSKLKDVPTFAAIAEIAMPDEFTIPDSSPPPLDCTALDYPIEPPLSIRFCVFLK